MQPGARRSPAVLAASDPSTSSSAPFFAAPAWFLSGLWSLGPRRKFPCMPEVDQWVSDARSRYPSSDASRPPSPGCSVFFGHQHDLPRCSRRFRPSGSSFGGESARAPGHRCRRCDLTRSHLPSIFPVSPSGYADVTWLCSVLFSRQRTHGATVTEIGRMTDELGQSGSTASLQTGFHLDQDRTIEIRCNGCDDSTVLHAYRRWWRWPTDDTRLRRKGGTRSTWSCASSVCHRRLSGPGETRNSGARCISILRRRSGPIQGEGRRGSRSGGVFDGRRLCTRGVARALLSFQSEWPVLGVNIGLGVPVGWTLLLRR